MFHWKVQHTLQRPYFENVPRNNNFNKKSKHQILLKSFCHFEMTVKYFQKIGQNRQLGKVKEMKYDICENTLNS